MTQNEYVLEGTERIAYELRGLYSRFGYQPYRMGKFEEYDLYSRHKEFLVSDSVITFTDTNGRLMALKPDVTLSIVKNTADREGAPEKLYYHENVYRVSKGTGAFGEIMQVGLECLGRVDACCIGEVLWLAAQSLSLCTGGDDYVLEVSHLGIMTALVARLSEDAAVRRALMTCVGEKNAHGAAALARDAGANEADIEALTQLLALHGTADKVLPAARDIAARFGAGDAVEALAAALSVFEGSAAAARVLIDFSAVSDTAYYNGIVFKGFVSGLPTSVLSGGQYDRLMQQMGRRAGAIGFAVYLDGLDRLHRAADGCDVDVVLLYGQDASPAAVRKATAALREQGARVLAAPALPEGITCGQVLKLQGEEVTAL